MGWTYEEALKRKLQEPWLLSWHWRAILPYIREWRDDQPSLLHVVQISQIRQWEMLLCYEINKDEAGYVKSADRDQLKLIRAPLFGVSHRTMRWDVYRLLYHPVVKSAIADSLQRVKSDSILPYSKPLSLAYVLGRHDFYYIISKLTGNADTICIEGSVQFDLMPEATRIYSGEQPIEDGTDDARLATPFDLVRIPAFEDNKSRPLLLSSDNYCKALDQLSEVLNDPTANSLLIVAPPGSGKEQLATMAFVCNNRLANLFNKKTLAGNRPRLVSTAIAGMSATDVHKVLFSMDNLQGRIDSHGHLMEDYQAEPADGMAFQAVNGALFIDEIDKATAESRSMLLRFLESGEITLPGSGRLVRLSKSQIPQYIFAGSMSHQDMFMQAPSDFWTRISHVVQMSHPLDVGDNDKVRFVTSEYIAMFWLSHVDEFLRKSGHIGTDVGQSPNSSLYEEFMRPYFTMLHQFLVSQTTIRFVCEVLSHELVGRGQGVPSVRRIRGAVGRGVFSSIELLLHSKKSESAVERLKEWYHKTNEDEGMCKWFAHLSGLFRNALEGQQLNLHSTDGVSLQELAFLDEFKQSIRASAVFSG